MPTYVVVPNDPKTFPDYAYNERIVDTQVGVTAWVNPPHNVDLDIYLTGYNRLYITTEYFDMMSRPDASHYYFSGSLASTNPIPSGKMREYVKYGKPDMGLIESRVGPSLTSKPKTRDEPNSYRPRKTRKIDGIQFYMSCRRGYRFDWKSRLCVKK